MKTILPTFVGIPLLAIFGIGFADDADAAAKQQRGFTTTCYGTPERCMRDYLAARPALRMAPRGYLPAQSRSGREYDFPRFGTDRWWPLNEDMD